MELNEIIVVTDHKSFSSVENIFEEVGALGVIKEEFKDKPGEVRVKAYFNQVDFDGDILKVIRKKIVSLKEYGLNDREVKVFVEELKEEDWANKWKENFKAIKISDRIIIKPIWEEYRASGDEIVIEIDPGRAFGTGGHATTSSSLKMIQNYLEKGVSFLDIGTGTGILSIAAAKLGASDILALDLDPVAVRAGEENARLNGVRDQIRFKVGYLTELVTKEYGLAVANILPHIILKLIPDLPKVIKEGGYFILSGIIEERIEEVKLELYKYDLELLEVSKEDEWITLVGVRR